MMTQDNIYIFGHKSPDTDSICAAVAYAHLKQTLGFAGAKPYRLGDVNLETQFVLDYFGVEAPAFLKDVRRKISDVSVYEPVSVLEDEPIKTAWDMMRNDDIGRLVPITCSKNKLKGIIGMGNVTEIFMDDSKEEVVQHHEILFKNLIKILDGRQIGGEYKYDALCGSIYLGPVPEGADVCDKDIVISGSIENAWKLVYENDFGCLILTNGIVPKGLENAKCAIVCVDWSTFKVVSLIKQAISARSIMNTKGIVSFTRDDYLDKVQEVMRSNRFRNFPIVSDDGTLCGVLSRRHVMGVAGKKVIMVDHNERSQSVDGLEQADIIEIIDHHRIADIQTEAPLYSHMEPLGCTCTIIYKMYKENETDIPKNMAGIMLGAILSDTLNFTSPTCTNTDILAGQRLAKIAEVDIDDFAIKMFKAGTDLSKMTIADMLSMDRKRFNIGDRSVYISQFTTYDFESIMERKHEILNEINIFYDNNECSLVMLMLTDLSQNGSEIFAVGRAKDLADTAFGIKHDQNHAFVVGAVSRKKQILPNLSQAASGGGA
ncbi:MAG: putative manganese-dependent inorganic diphosphatase [Defluviitaleaceae bacterium]|nr:putative manganese-dependent inorganic diphosphatase [Defluviitaleaceae bacterium]